MPQLRWLVGALLAFAPLGAGCSDDSLPVDDKQPTRSAPPAAQSPLPQAPAPHPAPVPQNQPRSDPKTEQQQPPEPRTQPVGRPDWIERGKIRVRFRDQEVDVESGRDVSNVVLEFQDGKRQKLDDLTGRRVTLRGTGPHQGKLVQRAWVKSGPNLSGDGPGYGERFDRPLRQPPDKPAR